MPLPKNFDRHGKRTVALERATLNEETRSIELAFSSEAPVERSWGMEVLGHNEDEMDRGWIGGGTAPLLLGHDPDIVVGVVESVTLGDDRKARAIVRFGRSPLAEEVMRDVADGIRTNVSVGYELLDIREEPAKKGEPQTYRAVRWRPLEVSLVSIPADMTVGVGREAPASVLPQPKTQEITGMEPEVKEAPAARAIDDGVEARRQKEIMDLATLANVRDMGIEAVLKGDTVELFRGKVLLARQGEAKPLGVAPAQLDMTPKEVARYSVFRAMRAAAENDWRDAGLELEAHRELSKRFGAGQGKRSFYVPLDVQKRDLVAATPSAGGNLVATDNISFIDILRARSVVMRMGAMRMTGLVGNVTVPRQTGAATAAWLANEGTGVSESDQTFGQMALSPKNVAAYTEISRQLMMQSSPSAEMIVMNDLAAVVALAVDSAAIQGTGLTGQPTGIISTSGIGSVTGTTIAYSGILEFQTDVMAANALINAATSGYVCAPAVAALLAGRQRFSSTDTPLWEGGLMDGRVAGFAAMSSTQMPASRLLFGDFSQLVIAEWGALELDVNPYANFPAGITGVRAFYTVDVGVRYAASFSYSTAIT
jgi:HK97 family phage major capsid protein